VNAWAWPGGGGRANNNCNHTPFVPTCAQGKTLENIPSIRVWKRKKFLAVLWLDWQMRNNWASNGRKWKADEGSSEHLHIAISSWPPTTALGENMSTYINLSLKLNALCGTYLCDLYPIFNLCTWKLNNTIILICYILPSISKLTLHFIYIVWFFFQCTPSSPPTFPPLALWVPKWGGVGGNLFKNFIKNGFHLLLLLGPAANGGVIK